MTVRERVRAGALWIAAISLHCVGYATQLPSLVAEPELNSPLVLGRVLVVVDGETSRAYEPDMRSLEFESQLTHERFNVEVKSEDRHFVITLSPGEYRLNRVQISEGPFMSMAELGRDICGNVAIRRRLTSVWAHGRPLDRDGERRSV